MKLVIHTDGGARGNPGPSAIGVVIDEDREGEMTQRHAFGKRIENGTNNTAEYKAVIEALQYVRDRIQERHEREIIFFLDSLLVVNQLNGVYKVKEPRLRELLTSVRMLESEVGGRVSYIAIPRERNQRADSLVNQALDA